MGIADYPIIQRIAELRLKQKTVGLDTYGQKELDLCLDWVLNKCYTQSLLYNYSLMASETGDVEWQHEICKDIEKNM